MQRQRFSLRLTWHVVIACIVIHALLAVDAARKDSPTVDEIGHMVAGLSYWQSGSFFLYRENPPLSRLICSVPLIFLDRKVPDSSQDESVGARREWSAALEYIDSNPAAYFDDLRACRYVNICLSAICAIVIFLWGRRLGGGLAGVLGTMLWCFEPNALAWAHIFNPDIAACLGALMSGYAVSRYIEEPYVGTACSTGFLLGVGVLCKFTLILLYPAWLIGIAAAGFLGRSPRCIRDTAAMFATSLILVNLGYGLEGSGELLGRYRFVSERLGGDTAAQRGGGNIFTESFVKHCPVPLPRNMVLGIDSQMRDFDRPSQSYLRGELRHRGWWYYYLYCTFVKLPLGTIAVLIGTALLCISRPREAVRRTFVPASAAIIIFGYVSMETGFNRHFRYVLPALALTYVAAAVPIGAVLNNGEMSAFRRRVITIYVACALLYNVGSVGLCHPHYLSYFNELAGGPINGTKHLISSNLDSGQDLYRLAEWAKAHPESAPLRLAYFGPVHPSMAGIEFTVPPLGPAGIFKEDLAYQRQLGPLPGCHVISVNLLFGTRAMVPTENGGWRYLPQGALNYLQQFEASSEAGYSLRIVHITLAQANAVRRQLGMPELLSQ